MHSIVPIFPVSGIMSHSPESLKYNRRSLVNIANTIIIFVGLVDTVLTIRLVIRNEMTLSSITAFAFFFVTVIGTLLLRNLAQKWPKLMLYWYKKEEIFLGYPYRTPKTSPTLIITVISVIIFLMVSAEHIFYYLNIYYETELNIATCNLTHKVNFWEHLFHRERAQVFDVVPFSFWYLPLFQIENFAFSFSGSYVDIMLISLSLGISTRFWQLYDRLNKDLISVRTENEWLCIRNHYGALADLVHKVNEHVSYLVLLSCSNNLISTPRLTVVSHIHFYIVLSVLIARTFTMLFATSTINDSSKSIANLLRRVPNNIWNIEVQRFIDQIESQTIALNGKSLFTLTRKLILAFAGTIVTFEIALLDKVPKETM
uniref:Gustatory receptor n=1 Tax=Culicoides sonorensis TaxID=179676 RepID=A0A336M476_CULSO